MKMNGVGVRLGFVSALVGSIAGDVSAQVDLGQVQVLTIGHTFSYVPLLPGPTNVIDFLTDQRQTSGGGGVLPAVSANFDLNNQFTLTISAPPGERFLVQPPAGTSVKLSTHLDWRGPAPLGANVFGTVTLNFGGLVGTAPSLATDSSDLSDTHGYFGFNDIQSFGFTGDLSFTSVTLTATVPSANIGRGTLNYTPDLDSSLSFYYDTTLTTDPGSFVSIVPEPSSMRLLLLPISLAGVLARCRRPRA